MQVMQPRKLHKESLNGDLSVLKMGLSDPKCAYMNLSGPK